MWHEATICFMKKIEGVLLCASQTQEDVKHLYRMHGMGTSLNACQIWLTMSFWRCITSKIENGGASEGKGVSSQSTLIQQHTHHDLTEMDKVVLHWRLAMDRCRFHAPLFGVIHQHLFFFFSSLFFCYKKPTLDEESVVCRYAEPNALWALTSINQETITDTSICSEKYLKHSFLCTLFTLKSFKYCY